MKKKLNESKLTSEDQKQLKAKVIDKFSRFFEVPPSNLEKFKFDGTDDMHKLTIALHFTNDESLVKHWIPGTKQFYRIAIKSAKEDLNLNESKLDYSELRWTKTTKKLKHGLLFEEFIEINEASNDLYQYVSDNWSKTFDHIDLDGIQEKTTSKKIAFFLADDEGFADESYLSIKICTDVVQDLIVFLKSTGMSDKDIKTFFSDDPDVGATGKPDELFLYKKPKDWKENDIFFDEEYPAYVNVTSDSDPIKLPREPDED